MKRSIDVVSACLGLILLTPVLLTLAILIRYDSRGPVFFVQTRVGKDFKLFNLYKFRTMVWHQDKIGPSVTASGDARITKIGKFLRKSKLDELPQLINVLKGDMSLVGPRPEVIKYVEAFRDDYSKILTVRPGITDLATIEYRDEEILLSKYRDPEEGYLKEVLPTKINLYKEYLDQANVFVDIKLIFKTIAAIIR